MLRKCITSFLKSYNPKIPSKTSVLIYGLDETYKHLNRYDDETHLALIKENIDRDAIPYLSFILNDFINQDTVRQNNNRMYHRAVTLHNLLDQYRQESNAKAEDYALLNIDNWDKDVFTKSLDKFLSNNDDENISYFQDKSDFVPKSSDVKNNDSSKLNKSSRLTSWIEDYCKKHPCSVEEYQEYLERRGLD